MRSGIGNSPSDPFYVSQTTATTDANGNPIVASGTSANPNITKSQAAPNMAASQVAVTTSATLVAAARADHTHASKARKQIVTMGSASSTYTWVYPTAFAAGVVPIVSAIVQVPAGTNDLFNVQVQGTPSNTRCTFQINRVSSGLLSLLTGALSINPTPIAATIHAIALEP